LQTNICWRNFATGRTRDQDRVESRKQKRKIRVSEADVLDLHELAQLRAVAGLLLPGSDASPPAESLPDLDLLMASAVRALGPEAAALKAGLAVLPSDLTWAHLKTFSEADPELFDVISTAAAGAYFMSTAVLESIGYPTGPRRAPRNDQAADELESGILDPVMNRDSMVRWPPTTDSQEL
jgi:hypothetical protein